MGEMMLANGQLPESLCTRIIGAGSIGTISTDLWGNVVHWSSEAQEMFGWIRDDAEGRPLDELLAPVLPDGVRSGSAVGDDGQLTEHRTGVFEILARGLSWSGTLARSRRDDAGQPRLLAATPFTSTKGAVIGHVVLCTGAGAADNGSGRSDGQSIRSRDQSESAAGADFHSGKDFFRRVFADSPVGTALVGTDGLILEVNSSLCRSLGMSRDELVGKNFVEFNHPDDRELELDYAQRLFDGKIDRFQLDRRFTRADGSVMTGRVTASAVRDPGGRVLFGIGVVEDVTERLRSEHAHLESEKVFRRTIEASSDAFVGMDSAGRVTDWNAAAERLFGWSSHEVFGMPLVRMVVPEEYVESYTETLLQALATGSSTRATEGPSERFFKDRAGREFPAEISLVMIEQDGGFVAKAFIRDVSERHALEDQLTRQALTDSLTGLPNRALLRDRLDTAVARLDRNPGLAAVMMLDLDRFKVVNDSLGHDAGDEMLRVVADRIRAAVRLGDTVGRVGGDEFVVVAEDFDDTSDVVFLADRDHRGCVGPVGAPRARAAPGCERRNRRRHRLLGHRGQAATRRGPLHVQGQGARRWVGRAVRRRAVRECTRASRARGRAEARHRRRSTARVLPARRLVRRRCDRVRGSRAMGASSTRARVSPADFIPLAEETGLVVPLGAWVLEHAAEQVARWQETINPALNLSVNLSSRQLSDPELPHMVRRILDKSGLPASSLCLELTETALIEDPVSAERCLDRAPEPRRPNRSRRLRDRLLVVDLRSQVPGPDPEAGQALRRRTRGERRGRDHCRFGDPPRARARARGDRRRCRDIGPAACARLARLRPGPGLLLVEAPPCRRDRAGSPRR